ncbi:hypothetical protein D6D23_09203 [Aureobasidium pullulans]|uniref:Mitochondrial thiamine pyrophosphate carrier 1 n=1 Tax=Aureobasidium pullulans TaxID=5580 RepID=A0A4S8VRF5_AURPU|nr:hypothetical protein D6D24_10262 [Aureobasidium pullulans]THW14877.1 hypothetical protein D6D23_09203 [Aureobasidium pullulans]THY32409.1 hypothetical protein D6D00_01552 [Aureobasidium pullulans]THY83700.1 hypothetical protein D6C92_09555 [Aureobasidium pullulans]TIA08092.1 hypothetical protein D6C81_09231 [Aureobasidium pullulans]
MDAESSAERENRARSLWKKLDTQNEGFLDFKAFRKGLKKLDHPLKNADGLIEDVLEAVDINNSGRIEYDEFRKFVDQTERELWQLFQSIDRNHDGNLDKNELRAAFVRAGLAVPNSRLDSFFDDVDTDNDGVINFGEWRDFLLFMPMSSPGLKAVMSYYQSAMKVTAEGDVSVSDDAIQGLGTATSFLKHSLFGAITRIASPPSPPQAPSPSRQYPEHLDTLPESNPPLPSLHSEAAVVSDHDDRSHASRALAFMSMLTDFVPDPGYFLAGGISGVASRTTTAPLDRLKVYLIAQTGATETVQAVKNGAPAAAAKSSANTLVRACKELWAAGGIRSLFAGNGLNVVKVMPESAVKFGSYEAAKKMVARFEGHTNTRKISPVSQFIAGGVAGMVSQAVVYPLDTLKFRMQCETVPGGLRGTRLIAATAVKMWGKNGIVSFYRGLPMGLVGMFPYAAIDLGTFEYLKRTITAYNVKKYGGHEADAAPSSFATALIGGFSGAFGASAVYPLNLLRTRLQSQGTASHPRTYTGIMDVTRQTLAGEGVRGLFKGLTPNLLKVVPAVSITYVVYENTKKALNLR